MKTSKSNTQKIRVQKVIEAIHLYSSAHHLGKFAIRNKDGGWDVWPKGAIIDYIRQYFPFIGVRPRADERISDMSLIFLTAMQDRSVSFWVRAHGETAGVHERSGTKILVMRSDPGNEY